MKVYVVTLRENINASFESPVWRCSRKGRERNNVSRIGGKFDSEVVK